MSFLQNQKLKRKLGMYTTVNFAQFTPYKKDKSKNILSVSTIFQQHINKHNKPNLSIMRYNAVFAWLSQENISNISPIGDNSNASIRRYVITGSRRFSNYWWASVISLGGCAFLLTGFSSFIQKRVFVFYPSSSIAFLPQGLIMCFYGALGLFFGIYLWCTVLWEVGNGFNEFNKEKGIVRIFRWGLPGKGRRIDLVYKIDNIEGVRVELVEGINPRRTISLRLQSNVRNQSSTVATQQNKMKTENKLFNTKDTGTAKTEKNNTLQNNIPLTRIGQPIGLEDIESEASELAQFLQVPLDSFYEL